MAIVSRILGAASLICVFGSSVQAETLASANAFACGVDAPSIYGDQSSARSTPHNPNRYPGAGVDFDVPSMVKLRIIYEYADRIEIDHCGGTVVDSEWIVTAAHCVAADSSWDRVEVIAGEANLDGKNSVRRVSRNAVCHSGFEYDGLKEDVALIRLDEPLPYDIKPAGLDQQNQTSAREGSTGLVAGWPVTGLKAGDRQLNKTQVEITDVQVPGYITAVSASGGPDGVCRGESGGPLMAYGSFGLQLAGVLSGIQPGTNNGQGEECVLSGYEMYFTPIAAFRGWMDNVRSLCSRNPALCSGSGSRGMLLANAPSYNGSSKGTSVPQQSAPAYVEAPAQPTYQPTYVSVGDIDQQFVAVAEAQPTYVPVAETQPTYVPVAQIQPTYIDVSSQYSSVDVSSQYVSYEGGYSVPAQPVYQNVGYQVALSSPVPAIDYSTSNYVSVGSIDTGVIYQPVASQYQDFSFEAAPAPTYVAPTYSAPLYQEPTYIETAPVYDNYGTYQSVSNYDQNAYSVAYAEPITYGSVYQPRAW